MEIVENKLLWTPEVLLFFGITDEKLLKEFNKAREDHVKSITAKIEGKRTHFSVDRRQSYVNLETLMTEENQDDDREIIEDSQVREMSKSVDKSRDNYLEKANPAAS